MFFRDFLDAYRANTLRQRTAWRAYDIPGASHPRYSKKALKLLGFNYAGELALSEFRARYAIGSDDEARAILAQWYVLREVEAGGRPQGLQKRPQT